MKPRLRWILLVAIAIVAVAILFPLFRAQPAHPAGPSGLQGEAAPVFELRDDRGAAVSLEKYRGRVVLVNLWATWCPPCRAEMPDLQRLYRAYAPRGLTVIGVNEGESAQRADAFAKSLGIGFPIWIDDRQQYGRAYAALGMPTTVIVGRDGIIAGGYDGALTFDQMRAAVGGPLGAR